MRVRFLSKDVFAALVMLAVALGGFETVRAGGTQHGEKIEFTEAPSGSPVVVSNLNKLDSSQSSFKQVKEDLLRPFGALDTRNTLQMQDLMNNPLPMPQQPMQAPMSKHTLEMLDKRRNWAFTSYQELFMQPTDEEMFGVKQFGADGQEKKAGSVVDRYYDNLGQQAGMPGKHAKTSMDDNDARAAFINRNGFDPLGKSFQSSDPFMKGMFSPEASDSVADKVGGVSFTGAGAEIGTLRETRMEQKRLDDMRRSILGDAGMRLPRPGEENTTPGADDYYSRKTKSAADALLNQQMSDAAGLKEKSANPFIVTDPTANALHSHINDDLTRRALGLSQLATSPTNNMSRPAPTAQSIQAEWDPFGANRPRPKF